MTNPRDKTLKDFTEALRWIDQHELDVTVIGGLAVGAFAASQGISLFSGDLDLLVTPQEQAECWETLPAELFESLLNISTDSSPAGRKYLARRAPSRAHADSVVAAAPESERAQLHSIATACHP